MKNKIVTHFYVKEEKKDNNGEVPIYLRITINGERAEISTNRKVDPSSWDKYSGRATGRSEGARIINAALATLLGKVEKYISNLEVKDELFSVHQIMAELKGKSQNQMTLIKAYNFHIMNIKELVGIDYAPNTVKRYSSSLNSLKAFMLKKYNKTDVRLNELDNLLIESYYAYLKTDKGLQQNSAAKDIKNLQRVINKAVSYRWILRNPFKDFSCNYTSINNLGLILSSKKIKFSRLDKVNDPTEGIVGDFHNLSSYFFISCWTNLEEENLALWNMYTPQMRGIRIELPLPIFNSYELDGLSDLLVPQDKIVDEGLCTFTSGGNNNPIKIEYTDDPAKLKPKIRTQNGLKTDVLGRCKRKIWSFEDEYRYILEIIPIDPNIKSQYISDRYEHLIEKNIPPSIDGYFIEINQISFSEMKILLSPKIIGGDYEIVNALVEKYNPKATIKESSLRGLIR